MSESAIRAAVLAFFEERGKPIPDGTIDLFDSGIIDSMDLIELVAHLESSGKYEIPHEALTVDNFRTLDTITSLLKDVSRA